MTIPQPAFVALVWLVVVLVVAVYGYLLYAMAGDHSFFARS